MDLTSDEKKILTLADENLVEGFCENTSKFLNLPQNFVSDTIERFLTGGLIFITDIPEIGGKRYFADRRNVDSEMFDDELRFELDFGESPILKNRE